MPVPEAIDESALCTACGLCCAGSIFDFGKLTDDEAQDMAARGVAMWPGDMPAIAFPCPMLSGACCTIYAERPGVCRRFRCEVLKHFEGGALDGAAARALIETARQLDDAARQLLPVGQSVAEARRAWREDPEHWRNLAGAKRIEAARLAMALTTLNLHLDRHFRRDKKRITGMDTGPT